MLDPQSALQVFLRLEQDRSDATHISNEASQGGTISVAGNGFSISASAPGDSCPFPGYGLLASGTSLQIPANMLTEINKQMCLEFWAQSEADPASNLLTTLNPHQQTDISIGLPRTNEGHFRFHFTNHTGVPTSVSGACTPSTDWVHWAVSLDPAQGSCQLYRNGISLALNTPRILDGTFDFSQTGGLSISPGNGTIKLARLRIWNTALSEDDIILLYRQDQGLLGQVYASHSPIDLAFEDEQGQAAIYILNAGEEEALKVKLRNQSTAPLSFTALSGTPIEQENSHVELTFKPNTLQNPEGVRISCPADWEASAAQTNPDQSLSFFLRYTGSTPGTLTAVQQLGSSLIFTFQGIRAIAGSEGSRGTRVLLVYRGFEQRLAGGNPMPIQGFGQHYLNIINHHGSKQLPLHVGVIGSNSILNNGISNNERYIKLHNTLPLESTDHISFGTQPATEIVVYFDQGEEEWNLIDQNNVEEIEIELLRINTDGEEVVVSEFSPRETPIGAYTAVWIFRCSSAITLPAGEFFLLRITGLRSQKADGFANAYVEFHDLPAYQDQTFVIQLEKTPLVIRGQRVGVDTSEPLTQFHLHKGELLVADQTAVAIHPTYEVVRELKADYYPYFMTKKLQRMYISCGYDPFQIIDYSMAHHFQATQVAVGIGNFCIHAMADDHYLYLLNQSDGTLYLDRCDIYNPVVPSDSSDPNRLSLGQASGRTHENSWLSKFGHLIFFYSGSIGLRIVDINIQVFGASEVKTEDFSSFEVSSSVSPASVPDFDQPNLVIGRFLYLLSRDGFILYNLQSNQAHTRIAEADLGNGFEFKSPVWGLEHIIIGGAHYLFCHGYLNYYSFRLENLEESNGNPIRIIHISKLPSRFFTGDVQRQGRNFYSVKAANTATDGHFDILTMDEAGRLSFAYTSDQNQELSYQDNSGSERLWLSSGENTAFEMIPSGDFLATVLLTDPAVHQLNFRMLDVSDKAAPTIVRNASVDVFEIPGDMTVTTYKIAFFTRIPDFYLVGLKYFEQVQGSNHPSREHFQIFSIDVSETELQGGASQISPYGISTTGRVQDQTGFVTPRGGIMIWKGESAPAGWAICDGSWYNESGNAVPVSDPANPPEGVIQALDLRSSVPAGQAGLHYIMKL
ncbi:MAG: LamG-like jellyroll fold domain-containing protein [Bacteroidota bacterium]